MKSTTSVILTVCFLFGFYQPAQAQLSSAAKTAKELIQTLIARGGQQADKEIAEMGGEPFVGEVLEKAAQDGGEKLVQQLAARTIEYGPALLKVAKSSSAKFLSAFDEMTPAMQKAAAQAMTRDPNQMAKLFVDCGKDALTAAAKHPGIGTQVMATLGREGAETLTKISTDEAIQLSRLAPQLAKVAEPERQTLMQMIGQAPGKIMDLLEANPKVLVSGTMLVAFIAAKDKILGGKKLVGFDSKGNPIFDEDQGFIARLATLFKWPISGILAVIGIGIAGYATVKIWGAYRIEKAKVQIKETELSEQARLLREQTQQRSPKQDRS